MAPRPSLALLRITSRPSSRSTDRKTVAAREAFYRLVNNEAVTLDDLIVPHGAQTIARAAQDHEPTIVALDRSEDGRRTRSVLPPRQQRGGYPRRLDRSAWRPDHRSRCSGSRADHRRDRQIGRRSPHEKRSTASSTTRRLPSTT